MQGSPRKNTGLVPASGLRLFISVSFEAETLSLGQRSVAVQDSITLFRGLFHAM